MKKKLYYHECYGKQDENIVLMDMVYWREDDNQIVYMIGTVSINGADIRSCMGGEIILEDLNESERYKG